MPLFNWRYLSWANYLISATQLHIKSKNFKIKLLVVSRKKEADN